MNVETLTYKYGETPPAAIVERAETMMGGVPFNIRVDGIIFTYAADLLTVLDALRAVGQSAALAGVMAEATDEFGHYVYDDEFPEVCAKLRRDILAALEIEES